MSLHERLEEALIRQKKIRQGWVYLRTTPSGPPAPKTPKEEALADLIRDASVNFDFSPILSGDTNYAQKVAEDFVKTLREYVSADESLADLTQDDLDRRLSQLWPWWQRSVNSFRDRVHSAFKVN